MHHHIPLLLLRPLHPPSIAQRQLSLTGQTSEYRDDMLRGFICFVDDYDAAESDGTQEGRISVLDQTVFKRGLEHELGDGGVAMKLYIFSWAFEELND